MKGQPYYLSERMRAASENLSTLTWVVIGIGVFLSLATNIAAAYFLRLPEPWPILIGTGASLITLGLAISIIWRIYSTGYDTSFTVEVVLPFRVTSRPPRVELLAAKPYKLTDTARQRFQALMRNQENQKRFMQDWHQAIKDKKKPFQGFVRESVRDLLVYLALDAFRKYAAQTLTPRAVYTKYGWRTIKLDRYDLPAPKWPEQLKNNLYLKDGNRAAFQVFKVPKGVSLDMNKNEDGIERCEISLKSDYGTVSVAISPYPEKVDGRSREGAKLYRYCGVPRGPLDKSGPWQEELWLAKFPLQISADLGGWRVFTEHFKQGYLPWVEGFLEDIKSKLDWQLCLERDLERMVVGLSRQMKTLLEYQSGAITAKSEEVKQ
jgi:hypothetical protein